MIANSCANLNPDPRKALLNLYLLPVERLGLSKNTAEGLKEIGIYDIGGLLSCEPGLLYDHELIAHKGLREIYLRLEENGIPIPDKIMRTGKVLFDRQQQDSSQVWKWDAGDLTFPEFTAKFLPQLSDRFILQNIKNFHNLSERQKFILEQEVGGSSRSEVAATLGITNRTLTNLIIDTRKTLSLSRNDLKKILNERSVSPARKAARILQSLVEALEINAELKPETLGFKNWKEILKAGLKLIKTLPADRARALKSYLKGHSAEKTALEIGVPAYRAHRLIKYAIRDLRNRFREMTGCNLPTSQIEKDTWVAFSTPERRKVFLNYLEGYSTNEILSMNRWLNSSSTLQCLTYDFRRHFNLSVDYLKKRRAVNKALRMRHQQKLLVEKIIEQVFPGGVPAEMKGRMTRPRLAEKCLQLSKSLSRSPKTSFMFQLRVYGLSNNQIGLLLKKNKGTVAINTARLTKRIRSHIQGSFKKVAA